MVFAYMFWVICIVIYDLVVQKFVVYVLCGFMFLEFGFLDVYDFGWSGTSLDRVYEPWEV